MKSFWEGEFFFSPPKMEKMNNQVINADVHQLPFKDESFDVVVCQFALRLYTSGI